MQNDFYWNLLFFNVSWNFLSRPRSLPSYVYILETIVSLNSQFLLTNFIRPSIYFRFYPLNLLSYT